jgi:hypothetical protein
MDIAGALGLLADDRALTEKCPLAQLARSLKETGAGSTREAAAAVLKNATADVEDAEMRVDQYEIARDKLKAELQRIEALLAEASVQRQRASTTAALCRTLIAAGFEDRAAPSDGPAAARTRATAVEGVRAEENNGARRDAEVAPPKMDPLLNGHGVANGDSMADHNDHALDQQRRAPPEQPMYQQPPLGFSQPVPPPAPSNYATPLEGVVTALDSAVEPREDRLIPLLAALEADVAQRITQPWTPETYNDWVFLAELLWRHVERPRPPVQLLEMSVMNSLLRRAAGSEAPHGARSLLDVAFQLGCEASLAKLLQSVNDDVKAETLEVVSHLASEPEARNLLLKAGLCGPIVRIVETSNSENVLERALMALWTFAMADQAKGEILDNGGVAAVLGLLFTDSMAILDNVAMALGHLTRDTRVKAAMRELQGLEKLVSCLVHPSSAIRAKFAGAVWNCGSDKENRAQLMRLGAVPLLVELLKDEAAQENAAGALWNLALEDPGKKAILEYGGLQACITLLSSPNDAVVEAATGTLWNCSATVDNRAALRKLGGLPPLVSHLKNARPDIRENAAGALRNLVINDQNKVAFREAGGIDLIVDSMDTASNTLLEKFMTTLWIVTVTPENKHALRLSGGLVKLLALFERRDVPLVVWEKALGTLRHCSSVPESMKALVEHGVVRKTVRVARSLGVTANPPACSPQVRENVACLLANVVREDKVGAAGRGARAARRDARRRQRGDGAGARHLRPRHAALQHAGEPRPAAQPERHA